MFEETTAATHTLTAEANALVTTTAKFRITGGAKQGRPVMQHPEVATKTQGKNDTPNPKARPVSPPAKANVMTSGGVTDGALAIADDDDWEDF